MFPQKNNFLNLNFSSRLNCDYHYTAKSHMGILDSFKLTMTFFKIVGWHLSKSCSNTFAPHHQFAVATVCCTVRLFKQILVLLYFPNWFKSKKSKYIFEIKKQLTDSDHKLKIWICGSKAWNTPDIFALSDLSWKELGSGRMGLHLKGPFIFLISFYADYIKVIFCACTTACVQFWETKKFAKSASRNYTHKLEFSPRRPCTLSRNGVQWPQLHLIQLKREYDINDNL